MKNSVNSIHYILCMLGRWATLAVQQYSNVAMVHLVRLVPWREAGEWIAVTEYTQSHWRRSGGKHNMAGRICTSLEAMCISHEAKPRHASFAVWAPPGAKAKLPVRQWEADKFVAERLGAGVW